MRAGLSSRWTINRPPLSLSAVLLSQPWVSRERGRVRSVRPKMALGYERPAGNDRRRRDPPASTRPLHSEARRTAVQRTDFGLRLQALRTRVREERERPEVLFKPLP